jgi:hypothetical protein
MLIAIMDEVGVMKEYMCNVNREMKILRQNQKKILEI